MAGTTPAMTGRWVLRIPLRLGPRRPSRSSSSEHRAYLRCVRALPEVDDLPVLESEQVENVKLFRSPILGERHRPAPMERGLVAFDDKRDFLPVAHAERVDELGHEEPNRRLAANRSPHVRQTDALTIEVEHGIVRQMGDRSLKISPNPGLIPKAPLVDSRGIPPGPFC